MHCLWELTISIKGQCWSVVIGWHMTIDNVVDRIFGGSLMVILTNIQDNATCGYTPYFPVYL